jgi:hypothetical protein
MIGSLEQRCFYSILIFLLIIFFGIVGIPRISTGHLILDLAYLYLYDPLLIPYYTVAAPLFIAETIPLYVAETIPIFTAEASVYPTLPFGFPIGSLFTAETIPIFTAEASVYPALPFGFPVGSLFTAETIPIYTVEAFLFGY